MARLRAFVPTLVLVSAAAIAAACGGGGDGAVDANSVIDSANGGGPSSGGSSSGGGSSGGDGGPPLIASTLSAGGSNACTIDAAGAVRCWGTGKGSSQPVGAGSTFSEISVGDGMTCAIKSDKTLWCWATTTYTPMSKDTGQFKKVASGYSHYCAINELGKLHCFGQNFYGQLGTGDNVNQANLVAVAPAKSWTNVSAGFGHTCALDDASALYCWGYNGTGEVGDNGGTSTDAAQAQQQSPVAIMPGTTWLDISAGTNATCGISSDRKLRCWGAQLGGQTKVPAQVDTATDWAMVRVGATHACALKTSGALYCWGQNLWGQVGNGMVSSYVATLAQVGSATDWAAVDVGANFTCARKTSGAIQCWGSNAHGELGAGLPDHLSPTKIGTGADWTYVEAANDSTCAVKKDGTMHCWGSGQYIAPPELKRQSPWQVGTDTSWSTVTMGRYHACARKADDSVHCWGFNYSGAIGVGAEYATHALPVSVGINATAVSAGDEHTCAIAAGTGFLWCWGEGGYGQLFANGDSLTPRKAASDFVYSKLATGDRDTCAIRAAGNDAGAIGDVHCNGLGHSSGANYVGELMLTGATDISVEPGGEDYRAVALGKIKLWSWIDNVTDDGAEQTWKEVSSGTSHRCAIRNDGTLACAGANQVGQVGDGTTTTRATLTTIGAANDWQQVSVGAAHTCGIRNGGELYCWGANALGQIGDNTAWSTTPMAVQ